MLRCSDRKRLSQGLCASGGGRNMEGSSRSTQLRDNRYERSAYFGSNRDILASEGIKTLSGNAPPADSFTTRGDCR